MVKQSISGKNSEFSIRSGHEQLEHEVGYDFQSILHYKHNQFARLSSLDTITPKAPFDKYVKKTDLGQREFLSELDAARVRALYKCTGKMFSH